MVDDLFGLVRYALGGTLLLACWWKLKDFRAFSGSLRAYGVSGALATAGALALICLEALAAAAAFSTVADATVGRGIAALGLLFTMAQTYLLATGQRVSCMCFGAGAAEYVSISTWAKAAIVLTMGLLLGFAGSGARSLEPPAVAGGLLIVATLAVLDRHRRARGFRPEVMQQFGTREV